MQAEIKGFMILVWGFVRWFSFLSQIAGLGIERLCFIPSIADGVKVSRLQYCLPTIVVCDFFTERWLWSCSLYLLGYVSICVLGYCRLLRNHFGHDRAKNDSRICLPLFKL